MVLILAGYWIVSFALPGEHVCRAGDQAPDGAATRGGRHRPLRHRATSSVPPGAMLLFIGVPLWLESYAGILVAAFPIATFVLRTLIEDALVRRTCRATSPTPRPRPLPARAVRLVSGRTVPRNEWFRDRGNEKSVSPTVISPRHRYFTIILRQFATANWISLTNRPIPYIMYGVCESLSGRCCSSWQATPGRSRAA